MNRLLRVKKGLLFGFLILLLVSVSGLWPGWNIARPQERILFPEQSDPSIHSSFKSSIIDLLSYWDVNKPTLTVK